MNGYDDLSPPPLVTHTTAYLTIHRSRLGAHPASVEPLLDRHADSLDLLARFGKPGIC